jgi:methylenetetrahydrofolate dehydrogenase (NADP+)/methenyltetrahydrofolate cyclohydrolase
VHGILVQLPLPEHVDETTVLEAVLPHKDADGFHPCNLGRLVAGDPLVAPATPAGIQQLLLRTNVETSGAEVVIVGRSNIVGKPLAAMLMQKAAGANATVAVCHTGTRDLPNHTLRADILVAAIGRPKAITAPMVAPGATVIDVGINRTEDGLVGDVDFDAVREVAGAITPVPGGVGPMTIAMLLHNVVELARRGAH